MKKITKRWLLFAVEYYEACGGMRDVQAQADTKEELLALIIPYKYDPDNISRQEFNIAHIFDRETGAIFELDELPSDKCDGHSFHIKENS